MSKILIDEAVVRDVLEALEEATPHLPVHTDWYFESITVLRQALEQPAPPECKTEAEKTAFAFGWYKALESVREQQAPALPPERPLDPLENRGDLFSIGWNAYRAVMLNTPPAPAQEPVIQDWMKPDALCDRSCLYACTEGFSKFPTCVPPTSPAQDPHELAIAYMSGLHEGKKRKPWVGLTKQEENELCDKYWRAPIRVAILAVEEKLMEKNQ